MDNRLINGDFNVIATMEINCQDFKHGIPLDYLLNKLKRFSKYLNNAVNVDTRQLVFGFDNASLRLVQPGGGEKSQSITLVQGLNFAKVSLVVDSSQVDSSKQLEEINVAKAELTSVITSASKISQKVSMNPVDASQLDDLINQTQYPDKVRNMLGNMSGPKEKVNLDEDDLTIGGDSFPTYFADGEVQTFNNCEILRVNSKGQIVFDISRSEEFSLVDVSEQSILTVEIDPKSLEFSYLAFVSAAKLLLDIEVVFSKHVINQQRKCSLVQILNRSHVSAEFLRKWLDVSQKFDLVG